MSGQLTMEKWDTFTVILKEYYLEGFYNKVYTNRKLEHDQDKSMRKIILETAYEWKIIEPYVGKEIINKVIDTI